MSFRTLFELTYKRFLLKRHTEQQEMTSQTLQAPSQVQKTLAELIDVDSFTYASESDSAFKKAMIAMIERFTGRNKVYKRYLTCRADVGPEESFWATAIRHMELDLKANFEMLDKVPKNKPVVMIANHPFGVVDAMMMCYIADHIRSDFKVLANQALNIFEEANPHLLPIDFTGDRNAMKTNLETRKKAREWLKNDGLIVVFPAGGVSTVPKPFFSRRAWDARWQPFTASLIQDTEATVLPIYFQGQNSYLFQIASHMNMTVRIALLLRECANKIGKKLELKIGEPLEYSRDLAHLSDRHDLINFLRSHTYALGGIEKPKVSELKALYS